MQIRWSGVNYYARTIFISIWDWPTDLMPRKITDQAFFLFQLSSWKLNYTLRFDKYTSSRKVERGGGTESLMVICLY